MGALEVFSQGDWNVRAIEVDGQPLFHHADVCKALEHTNPTVAARMLDADEWVMVDMRDITAGQTALNTGFTVPSTGNSTARFVTEPGMYSLIMSSRAKGAKAFQRWVFHDVLPQIRKTGSYAQTKELSRLEWMEEAIKSEREKVTAEIERDAARSALVEVTPMVEAYQDLMDSEGFISMGAAARAVNMGRQTFFDELRRLNIIQKHENLPYRSYDRYFDVKFSTYEKSDGTVHTAKPTLRVRPEGLDYLRRRLTTGLAQVG